MYIYIYCLLWLRTGAGCSSRVPGYLCSHRRLHNRRAEGAGKCAPDASAHGQVIEQRRVRGRLVHW